MSTITINKNNFENEVFNSDKKVLIDFWAPRCGACRMIDPIINELGQEISDVKIGKINVDENPDLASQFGIMSIPTLVVIENGEVIRQSVGAKPKKAILEMIQETK